MIKRNLNLFNWTFIGVIIYSLCQWLIIFVLNKNLDYENVGLYTYSLAIVSPVFIFSYLQLRTVYITKAYDKIEIFIILRLFFMVFTFLFMVVFSQIINFSKEYNIIILALSFIKFGEGISDIVYAYFHREQQMKIISQSMIIRSVSAIIIFILVYQSTNDFLLSFTLYAIYSFFFSIAYDLIYLARIKEKIKGEIFNPGVYKSLFLIALPMGIVTLISNLSVNVPRYVLEYKASLELLGVFGSLIYLVTILTKITTSLSQVLSPKLANAFNNKNFGLFKKIAIVGLLINITIGSILVLVIGFFGELILTTIYTNDFSEYTDEFLYLSVFGLLTFVGGFLGNILTSMKVFNIQVYVHSFKLIIITIFSFILIHQSLLGVINVLIIGAISTTFIYSVLIISHYRKEVSMNAK